LERTSLFILGMHRAGTSALARVLSLRGAQLPQRVLPANAGNTSGYWEPEAVVALDERILASFDLAWDDPSAPLRLPAAPQAYAAFMDEAREILRADFGDAPLSVVKDPRCTLLQPFWREVLAAEGVRPAWVVMMRPWREVVDSLVRRDGCSAHGAALVYVAHGLVAADAAAEGATCVTYAQLLDDWRATTDRIAAEQGVHWPHAPDDAAIDAFLRDANTGSKGVVVPPDVAAWADTVWDWFDRAARGERPSPRALDAVRDAFGAIAQLIGPLLRDRTHRLLEAQQAERIAIDERNTALQVYRETDERLQRAQATAQREIDRLDEEILAVRREYEALRQDYEAIRLEDDARLIEIDRINAMLHKAQSDYAERDLECESLRAELAEAVRQADEARRELGVILGSRSWKITRPLRFANRVARHAAGAPDERPLLPRATARTARAQDTQAAERSHPGLRRFLDAEFDAKTTQDTIALIERYRLPVSSDTTRRAARLSCSEDDAVAWALAIATRPPLAPVASEDVAPDVSIIVPVYNQVPFTLACIDALLAHDTRYRIEVLVGDDGSTDATAAALAIPMPGVRHIRHADNLGFVRNCNATAAQARGRHVVFLNNDTLVLPGWLDELIDTLETQPRIGLAGSKLIFPDGRLQECGGIVWRDGSAWNYGRLADPRRPEFCYLRDVDYVSGASIALPRALWEQLGGFDELFVPAYAEDADLAFRVRAAGLRTVVQPLSQLLHFEGISSGTDLGSGVKAYQVDNLRKLRERWAGVLATHRDNADQPELEKERHVVRRVLFVDKTTPTPSEDAGSVVADEILQGMVAAGCKVTFVPEDNFAHVGAPTRALQRRGIEAIYHPAHSRMASFVVARKESFDVIFLHRFAVGEKHLDLLRRRYPDARVLFLNADMHWLREMREAELAGSADALAGALMTRERELSVVGRVDVALVHSDYERTLLREALPDREIALFPLVQDPAGTIAPLAGRDGVCFVGGFRHPPNADAIRWFVETAWPRVLEAVPDARLDIVGSHMPADIRALGDVPGVRAVGFVEDLEGFLARRRVTIAPLRYGAGAKGKVAASLAQGVPAVCTPVAAEGMLLSPGEDVLVGESPEALADHVIALLRDDALWQRVSAAGLDYARRVTSRDSARERLRALLDAR
jgi:GT2 family glycosyltransferase/glycosyltransferase involved in cell wall biosynthesis